MSTATGLQLPSHQRSTDTMSIALGSLEEICTTMFMIDIKVAENVTVDPTLLGYGGVVTLYHSEVTWELGLYATTEGGEGITREISGMMPEAPLEDGAVVDALGEIANMAAGAGKNALGNKKHGELSIAPPLCLQGKDCLQHLPLAIPVYTQALEGTSFGGNLIFAWTERSPRNLLFEIDAVLETCESGDKMGLTQTISLFQEFQDSVPDEGIEDLADHIEACEEVLTELIKGDSCLSVRLA